MEMKFKVYQLGQQDQIPVCKVVIDWPHLASVKITGYPNPQIFWYSRVKYEKKNLYFILYSLQVTIKN